MIARRREGVTCANARVSLYERPRDLPSQILKDQRLLEWRLKQFTEAWEHWK